MRCIEVFIIFVSQDNKDPLIYTMPEVVYARDLSLSVRKDYSDCSTALELVQRNWPKKRELMKRSTY